MNEFYTDAMVPGAATNYGCTIPRRGRELIAKVLAAKIPLKITRVMMGQGICPENVFPGDLEDLIEPVAAGTSGEPTYDGDTVHMTVEYRSDLNGGLERGFWIREFGVFAQDVDGGEVMLYYGSLGDYPQWVSAYSTKGLDVRRYPVSITVGEGAEVIIDYSPDSFMTSDDVKEYCIVTMLPQFIERAQEKIAEHNADPEAHPAIQSNQAAIDARLSLLELMYNTDVSGNPFTVTFDNLGGLKIIGIWNAVQKRVEF